MAIWANLNQRKKAFAKWYVESGAKEGLAEFKSEISSVLRRHREEEEERNAALAPLELRAGEELRRGRTTFTVEVDASSFPEAEPEGYERITYEVEERLTSALPLKCTEIRHADAEGKSVLTFERVEPSVTR